MRKSARAIVIKDGALLVMCRNKFGSKYVTLPGGAIEMGESPDACAVREVAEETSVTAQNPRLVCIDQAEFYGDQLIFVCQYVSGEPQLSAASTEASIHQMGKNLYEPGWLPLSQLPEVPFLSRPLQQFITKYAVAGWPDHVVEFTSKRSV